jgi:hypothetical protein
MLWLGILLHRAIGNWQSNLEERRRQLGVLLSASFAILANALLSYSYTSKQFVIYLSLFLLVAATADTRAATRGVGAPPKTKP